MGRSGVIVVGGVASVKDLLGHGWGQGSCYWGHGRVGVLSNKGAIPLLTHPPGLPMAHGPPHLAYLGSHQPLRSKPDSDQSKPTEIFDICQGGTI